MTAPPRRNRILTTLIVLHRASIGRDDAVESDPFSVPPLLVSDNGPEADAVAEGAALTKRKQFLETYPVRKWQWICCIPQWAFHFACNSPSTSRLPELGYQVFAVFSV
eukprot:1073372-Amphidinium_carterae.1